VAAELVQSGWVLAVDLVAQWLDDSAQAGYSAPAGQVVLTAHGSTPADYLGQADPGERHCSLGAQPVQVPAELRHDSPERYMASPLASRAQRRGR
jgi:hypothetical protein